jgi:FkbM family methyltransferase
MTSNDVLLPVSRWELVRDRALRALLRRLAARNARKGRSPRVCIPSSLIGQVIVVHGLYEADLLTALFEVHFADRRQAFAEGTILDVGANIGNHAVWFASRFSKVVCFEPNPTALAILRANVVVNRLDNVEVVPVGLSDAAADLTFAPDPINLGLSRFSEAGASGSTSTLRVERGDDVLAGKDLPPILMVKIDVEGHEVRALSGLTDILSTHKPIVLFESHGNKEPGGGAAVFAFLRGLGYGNFVVVEPPPIRPGPRLVRFLQRLWSGGDLVASEISEPEDRFYALIVASAD